MDGSNLSYTRIIGDTGQQPALNPPPEMVEEIRVIANNYGAEYEEGSGWTITVSTKSGTNEIHGVVYEYMQNRAFNSCNFFSPIKSPRNYNQFGGAAGGSIVRDKTFWFVTLEGEYEKAGAPNIRTVLTLAQRRGDFSRTFDDTGVLIPVYDPATNRLVNGANVRDPLTCLAIFGPAEA